jgi:hypothetical protein
MHWYGVMKRLAERRNTSFPTLDFSQKMSSAVRRMPSR